MAGAKEVVLLDREEISLKFAAMSAHLNGKPISALHGHRYTTCKIVLTDYCMGGAGVQDTVKVRAFDWHKDKVEEPFDVVIATDVLYESDSVPFVAELLVSLLTGTKENADREGSTNVEGSSVYVTDPQYRTPANQKRFIELMTEQGLEVETSQTSIEVEDVEEHVTFITITKKNES